MPEPSPHPPPYVLPPLILHPFTEASASLKVLESAKAALQMVAGAGRHESPAEELRERLLDGRYAEFRMLYFVGKDISRWTAQCVDFAQRTPELKEHALAEQSFAEFLIARTPPEVEAKLRRWGVNDYGRIFARSIGIYVQFLLPPPRQLLAHDYLRLYYRFADYAYACWKDGAPFPTLSPAEFTFALYASGEYSKLLEEQWNS